MFFNQLDKDLNIKNYDDLHNWSIKHKNEFWSNVWDFTNFVGEKKVKFLNQHLNLLKINFLMNVR